MSTICFSHSTLLIVFILVIVTVISSMSLCKKLYSTDIVTLSPYSIKQLIGSVGEHLVQPTITANSQIEVPQISVGSINQRQGPSTGGLQPLPPPVIISQPRSDSILMPLSPTGVHQVTIVPQEGAPEIPYISREDTSYHQLGYIQSDTTLAGSFQRPTYRLYGRRKYARSERFEYYIINEVGIRIPFTQSNEKELYDTDKVTVPGFDTLFTVHIYPVRQIVYNQYMT